MAENSYKSSIEEAKKDIENIRIGITKIGEALTGLNADLINKLNTAFGSKSPQDFANNVKQVDKATNDLKEKTQFLAKETERLQRARQKLTVAYQQGKLDERIAVRNAKEQAVLNSKMTDAYDKLNVKMKQKARELRKLIASEKASTREIKKATREFEKYRTKVNQANAATQNFAKGGLGSAMRGIQNLMGAFGVVGGLYLFADMAKQGFRLARQLDSINFAMKTVITDAEELARTQAFLADITERYGAEVVTTTERYIKFLAAAKQSGVALKDTERIFGTMTKAAGALGLKTHELEGVYLALEQMLSKGKVTTEELRRQLGERLPGAFGIMAKAVGVSTDELDKMLRKGEILAGEVLPKFADEVEKAYGLDQIDRVENLNASVTRLSNTWVAMIGNITESDGPVSNAIIAITDKITALLKILNEFNLGFEDNFNLGKQQGVKKAVDDIDALMTKHNRTIEEAGEVVKEHYEYHLKKYRTELGEVQKAQSSAWGQLKFFITNGETADKVAYNLAESIGKYSKALEVAKDAAQGNGQEWFDFAANGDSSGIEAEYGTLQYWKDKLTEATERYNLTTLETKDAVAAEMAVYEDKIEQWKRGNKVREEGKEILDGSVDAITAIIRELEDERDRLETTTQGYKEKNKEIEKYNELLKRLKEGTEAISSIEQQGMFEPNDDWHDRKQKELDAINEGSQIKIALARNETDKLKEFYDRQVQDAIEAGAGKDEIQALKDKHKERLEVVQDALDKEKELRRDFNDAIRDLVVEGSNAIMDARVEKTEEEIALNREKYATILDNQEWSEEQRMAIEAERDAKEAKLEKKKRQREKEAFLVKQGLAVAEIGINLAKTISAINLTAALLDSISFGVGGQAYRAANIPIAIGTAAAQTGLVLAQTLPKFEKGTDNAPEGLAIIDEKRPEVHMDKHGNIKSWGQNKGARLTYTEKGDKIIPSHDLFFKQFGEGDMQKAVWDLNMQSNGEALSQSQVDRSLLNEMSGMRKDITVMGRRIEKLAYRPISVNNKVEIPDNRSY